jgi:hypothetical protein
MKKIFKNIYGLPARRTMDANKHAINFDHSSQCKWMEKSVLVSALCRPDGDALKDNIPI